MFHHFAHAEPKRPANFPSDTQSAKRVKEATVKVERKSDGKIIEIHDTYKNSLLQARYGSGWWDAPKEVKKARQTEQKNFRSGDSSNIFGRLSSAAPPPNPAPVPPKPIAALPKPAPPKPTVKLIAAPTLPLAKASNQYYAPFIGLSNGLFNEPEKALELDTYLKQKFEQHIPGWVFKWDKAARRYGVCRYRGKQISVSLARARVNTVERTKRTILHEIAHALTPGQKHNNVWKQKAREIGLTNPTRCFSNDDTKVCLDHMKWALRNRETKEIYRYWTREPKKKDRTWSWIRGKKGETFGKLEVIRLAFSTTKSFAPYTTSKYCL